MSLPRALALIPMAVLLAVMTAAQSKVVSDVPLTFADVSARKLMSGERFNVKAWSGDGATYKLSADSGDVRSTQPGSAIY